MGSARVVCGLCMVVHGLCVGCGTDIESENLSKTIPCNSFDDQALSYT